MTHSRLPQGTGVLQHRAARAKTLLGEFPLLGANGQHGSRGWEVGAEGACIAGVYFVTVRGWNKDPRSQ